jgi:hypothetical protein
LCTRDRSEKEYNEYFATMPWIAVPWKNKDQVDRFAGINGVEGIPSLHVMDVDRSACHKDARSDVTGGKHPSEVVKMWKKKMTQDHFKDKEAHQLVEKPKQLTMAEIRK